MKKVQLVFIHGFLGSEQSFLSFPTDVSSSYMSRYPPDGSNEEIQVLMYPKYDTKGNNSRQVQQLVNWLLINSTTSKYSKVILLAHSMGGLLATDAYAALYTHTNIRLLVNITGIIAFDAPFFGIKPSVLTTTGLGRVSEIARSSHEFLTQSMATLQTATREMQTSTKTKWITAAALVSGAAMVYTTGMASVASTVLTGVATRLVENARHYLEFLYPLSNSASEMEVRFKHLKVEMDAQRLKFRGFYLVLPFSATNENTDPEISETSNGTHFCNPPPESYTHYFQTVGSAFKDVIDAHMYMFNAKNEEYYEILRDHTIEAIRNITHPDV